MTGIPEHAIHATNLPARYQSAVDAEGVSHAVDLFEQVGSVSEVEARRILAECGNAYACINDGSPDYVECIHCCGIVR
jgi:hypothetical protein